MSTRATVHFEQNGEAQAIVYRHSDGYPEGLGNDLQTFFGDVQSQTRDTRFSDPCYLAAKFVVWQAARYAQTLRRVAASLNPAVSGINEDNPLDFLGVGIVMEDPDDIEYRYHVDCNEYRHPPLVTVEEV